MLQFYKYYKFQIFLIHVRTFEFWSLKLLKPKITFSQRMENRNRKFNV